MDCNVRCCAAVIFVAIVATLTSKGTGCLGLTSSDPGGHTVPSGDIFIKYGDPLKIMCNIDSQNYDSSSIVFTSVHSQAEKPELIDPKFVRILNSTAAELFIEKPSPVQEATYTCAVKNGTVTKENFSNIRGICVNAVTVGLPPQDVGNLSCVSHNWDSLNCSWKGPQNYDSTSYNLSYAVGSNNEHRCPKVTRSGDWYNCVWNKSTSPIYRQPYDVITLILTASNRFGRKTWNKSINHFANVIPNSPQGLRYNSSATNFTIFWNTPSGLEHFPPGLDYELLYRSQFTDWQRAEVLHKKKGTVTISLSVTDLIPFTQYEVLIRCKSGKNENNLWSEYAAVNVTTKAIAPSRPPKTDTGSFEVSVLNNGQRNVSLYWQQLEPYEENGPNIHYKIVKVEMSGTVVQVRESKQSNWFASYKGLSDETYKFYITSSNDEGDAPAVSEITVPDSHLLPPLPEAVTKVPFDNGTYEISWRVANSSDITGFTVYWCENRSDRNQCSGNLNWTKVDNNTLSKSISLPEESNYQFAISAESGPLSSGLSWVSCTNLPDGFTRGQLKGVKVIKRESERLQLSWKPVECADKLGVVLGYCIKYCLLSSESNCADENCPDRCSDGFKMQNITDATAVHGTLYDLEPYSSYIVSISVITKNWIGFESEPKVFQTGETSPEKISKVFIDTISNSSITISWQMPSRHNGIIRHFIVYWNYQHKIIPVRTNYVLSNLQSWKDYNISVSACTLERSCSVPSDIVTVKTEMGNPNAPSVPSITFANLTELIVEWSPPSNPSGIVAHYDVLLELRDNDNIKNLTFSNIKANSKQITVDQCLSEDTYPNLTMEVFVRAVNIRVDGTVLLGKWSPSVTGSCLLAHAHSPESIILISLFGVMGACGIFALCIWLSRLVWLRCKDMREVGIKLPERLKPRRELDKTDSHSLEPWGYDPKDLHNPKPSPDQQRLLDRKQKEEADEEGTCADESGCGSGQESVSSVASDARISADSGTEADSGEREGSPPQVNGAEGAPNDVRGTPYITLPAPAAAVPRQGYVTIAPFSAAPVTPDPGYVIVGAPSSPLPISPLPVSPLPVSSVSPLVVSPVAPPSYCVLGLKNQDVPKSLQSFSDLIQEDVLSSLHSN